MQPVQTAQPFALAVPRHSGVLSTLTTNTAANIGSVSSVLEVVPTGSLRTASSAGDHDAAREQALADVSSMCHEGEVVSLDAARNSGNSAVCRRPRRDSNSRSRLRRAVLYPLSYGGRWSSLVKDRKAMYQRDSWQEVVSWLWDSLQVLFSTRAGPLVERARCARGRARGADHVG
jgi:hypothetical protein